MSFKIYKLFLDIRVHCIFQILSLLLWYICSYGNSSGSVTRIEIQGPHLTGGKISGIEARFVSFGPFSINTEQIAGNVSTPIFTSVDFGYYFISESSVLNAIKDGISLSNLRHVAYPPQILIISCVSISFTMLSGDILLILFYCTQYLLRIATSYIKALFIQPSHGQHPQYENVPMQESGIIHTTVRDDFRSHSPESEHLLVFFCTFIGAICVILIVAQIVFQVNFHAFIKDSMVDIMVSISGEDAINTVLIDTKFNVFWAMHSAHAIIFMCAGVIWKLKYLHVRRY